MSLLEVDRVSLRFGGVAALSEVSLRLERDALLGFIGPNGAGKTTLLRVVTGVLRPQQGRVVFDGRDVSRWSVARRVQQGIALAQQIVRPLPSLSVLDNVALAAGRRRLASPWAALRHSRREAERARARELLAAVGIADTAARLPGTLPLGYRKRLEVARALALQPKLLLLDEPLAGLNQSEATALADLIAGLAGGGRSVLLIEHNIREVARICPQLYVQDNGRRLLYGETAAVMNDPRLRRAYLGVRPG